MVLDKVVFALLVDTTVVALFCVVMVDEDVRVTVVDGTAQLDGMLLLQDVDDVTVPVN